jgi:NAD(P)-dependent dehydrogenase (short-subunit alcohol dehydrogenase family)
MDVDMQLSRLLDGKRALITGSTDGIGAATARLFAAQGADVIVSGRDAGRGESVAAEIAAAGGTAAFVHADLTDIESVRRLAEQAGEIDILVNNAATSTAAATVDLPVEQYDLVFALNVRAPFFLTAALAPAMIARGSGSIVNISSGAATTPMAGLAAYTASKAALNALTRAWALEFSPSGVRVNTVSPGPTLTPKVEPVADLTMIKEYVGATLLGRHATTLEIANVVLFVASDLASYMTGALVPVEGGTGI